MDDSSQIKVQICFATPHVVTMLDMHIPTGTSLLDAIKQSQVCLKHREIDLKTCKFGIFGKLKSPDTLLRDGDRVEIYRALVADPMEARRRRARKQSK